MAKFFISINCGELIYDIQNKTYLTGKSHADGSNHRKVAQMQANNDDDNLNQILRSVQMALANLRQEIGEWLAEEWQDVSNSDLLDASGIINLPMELPSNFNSAMVRSLTDSIHQYVVAFAISEWFVITNRDDAAQYAKIADEALLMTSKALSQRLRPKRNSDSKQDDTTDDSGK